MHKKKALLIQILEKLVPYRELAEGFLLLVKESEDKLFIDEVYQMLLQQIKVIESNKMRQQLTASIERLREKESKSQMRDNEDADKLFDDLLTNLE